MLLSLYLLGIASFGTAQKSSISSPNKRYNIEINLTDHISWNVSLDDIKVIENAVISMNMGFRRVLGNKPRLKSKKLVSLNELIKVQVPNKNATINSRYNQLTMSFKDGYL